MAYSRKTPSDAGDRQQLEMGEARMLYRTWESTKQKVLTKERMEHLERRYGLGVVARVRNYMDMMRKGEIE